MVESLRIAGIAALAWSSFLSGCGSTADSGAVSEPAGAAGVVSAQGGASGSTTSGSGTSSGGGASVAGANADANAGGAAGSGGTPAMSQAGAGGNPHQVAAGGTSGMAGAGSMSGAGGAGGPVSPPATRLKHPGILNSASELSAMKAQIKAQAEPWLSAFNTLKASGYASLSYAEKPYASVECGSYNKPNIGCSQMVDDGMAAYAHALMWNATGDIAYAAKALEIIDAWARVYQQNLQSNSNLVVGWATPWYANAAEILRYSNAGWTSAAQQRFLHLLSLWLPYVITDDGPQNNWMQSRIEAHMAIAVFFDDAVELAKAEARWSKYLPLYVLDSGLGGETCRDLGHLGLGIRSMMYAAETAWQQGADLFAPNQARLAKFIELHGSWMLGEAAVPSSVCGGTILAGQNDSVGIKPPMGGGAMPLEILYAQLHGRLGVSLPNLREMIQRGRPIGGGHWVLKWETLTYGMPL